MLTGFTLAGGGTTEERRKVNRMLAGRQVCQVEGRAVREEV